MSKKQQEVSPVDVDAPVEVRALCDLQAFGASAGCLVLVPAGVVQELRSRWLVDDAPEAVEYARSLSQPEQ